VTYQHRSEAAPDHTRHEPMLISRMDDPDLDQRERADVERWLATCGACRELHADLVSLRQSLAHDLPSPRRPRDFRLSPAMLEERHQRRDVLAVIRRLVAPETPWATQLAGAALVIGLGLVLASGLVSGLLGGGQMQSILQPIGAAVQAPSGGVTSEGGASAVSAPPSAAPASSAPSVPASSPFAVATASVTTPPTASTLGPLAASQSSPTPRATAPAEAATPSVPPGPSPGPDLPVALVGVLLALGGGALMLGRWSMRRRLL
jgi:hypothetical protein